jgi:hypothetical protein
MEEKDSFLLDLSDVRD